MSCADTKIMVFLPMHMVQSTIEKLREDLQRKDNDLLKMTKEKEQYQGKAAAGDSAVKSLQVIVCVSYTYPIDAFHFMLVLAWTCIYVYFCIALACIPAHCVCTRACILTCVSGVHMCMRACVHVFSYVCAHIYYMHVSACY